MEGLMSKKLIYDLPTRIFHWSFASLFVFAFFIAKTVDDDSPTFSYHMLAGLMLSGLVVMRILWGFIGSKYAKFQSFALHPKDLIEYAKGILSGDKKKWTGHNPASSWAAMIMISCGLGLALTGILMSTGEKETFEDIHELFANGFLISALLHIAGVLLHTIRHQDGIAFSMIHGNKNQINGEGIPHSGLFPALILLIFMLSLGSILIKNYDPSSGKLILFGKTLQLGEDEEEDD
jgi:cytochrome b